MDNVYTSPFINFQTDKTAEDSIVWYIVAVFILLALGATIILGAIAWCFMHATRELSSVFSLNTWTFKVGCK